MIVSTTYVRSSACTALAQIGEVSRSLFYDTEWKENNTSQYLRGTKGSVIGKDDYVAEYRLRLNGCFKTFENKLVMYSITSTILDTIFLRGMVKLGWYLPSDFDVQVCGECDLL